MAGDSNTGLLPLLFGVGVAVTPATSPEAVAAYAALSMARKAEEESSLALQGYQSLGCDNSAMLLLTHLGLIVMGFCQLIYSFV